jgi:hypothetical protein
VLAEILRQQRGVAHIDGEDERRAVLVAFSKVVLHDKCIALDVAGDPVEPLLAELAEALVVGAVVISHVGFDMGAGGDNDRDRPRQDPSLDELVQAHLIEDASAKELGQDRALLFIGARRRGGEAKDAPGLPRLEHLDEVPVRLRRGVVGLVDDDHTPLIV